MKMTLLLALLVVLAIALSTKPLPGAAASAPEPVLDTSGKKVRTNVAYNVIPASYPYNGGVSIGSVNQSCPFYVVGGDSSNGPLPLYLSPVNEKKGVIRVHTDLNIYFLDPGTDEVCSDSSVWMLKDYDSSATQKFVTLGGAMGNPGKETLADWFKIEKYEDAYKFYYCPNVYYDGSYPCSDIGISEDEYGNKRLTLSDVPYKVWFQHA